MNNLISVIIPVYNKSEELRASLASLLSQTWQDYEVIIVNDGSTDNSVLVIDELKHKFYNKKIRFKIIQQNNQGSNNARNRGFKESRGEYVIFWDADIVASPEMLIKMYDKLQENSEAKYAYSSFIFGKKKFKLWEFDEEKLKKIPYIHSTSLMRRAYFPGWDARIDRLQDWDLWLTMLQRGYKGVWVPEFLFTVLTEHGTMSSWFPKILYKLPVAKSKEVKKYKEAVNTIRRKHQIVNNK
ncbi:MAG: glycosyltransferase family A protein [Candidatus Falkowbacteria bacterium]